MSFKVLPRCFIQEDSLLLVHAATKPGLVSLRYSVRDRTQPSSDILIKRQIPAFVVLSLIIMREWEKAVVSLKKFVHQHSYIYSAVRGFSLSLGDHPDLVHGPQKIAH